MSTPSSGVRSAAAALGRAALRAAPVLLAGACLAACSATGPSARVTALLGGAASVAAISDRSDAVVREAFRIDGDAPMRPADRAAPGTVLGYPILAGPVPVDAATAASLADVLLDDSTYLWDEGKFCAFQPGVAVRATRGGTTVDVLLCFSCDQVEVWMDGRRSGLEDTDPRRADLVSVAKRLFPDDAAIRALR